MSAESDKGGLLIGRKRQNLVEPGAQELRCVSRGAVAETDPDHLRRKAAQNTQSVEILVFRDEQETPGSGMLPNCGIGRAFKALIAHTWVEPG